MDEVNENVEKIRCVHCGEIYDGNKDHQCAEAPEPPKEDEVISNEEAIRRLNANLKSLAEGHEFLGNLVRALGNVAGLNLKIEHHANGRITATWVPKQIIQFPGGFPRNRG